MALKRSSSQELHPFQTKTIKLETDHPSISGNISTLPSEVNVNAENERQEKSCQDSKEELFSLLSLLSENCGDFATGGVLPSSELQCHPNIEIKVMVFYLYQSTRLPLIA